MRRVQPLVAVLIAAASVAGAVYADRELGPRAFARSADGPARSGVWLCPHGGGPEGWEAFVQVANPGPGDAVVRVRTLGTGRPSEPETITVAAGSFVRVPVPADGRARTSLVEWFGQWVAVGWLTHGGGGEGGVAAEPCAPQAGTRWFLPDGSTEVEGNQEFVVVMNPFARPAVFSLTLLSERKDPVQQSGLTDVVLKPYHSVAFNLNQVVLGERTVSTMLEVSVGRVAAATLGVAGTGGIRSALGYLGEPPATLTYPAGADAGRTEVPIMRAGIAEGAPRVELAGEVLSSEPGQVFAGLAEASLPPGSARTFPTTTVGASAVVLSASGAPVAAVRRTYGVVSDQASTGGAEPAADWLVLPTAAGSPSNPGLVLANPGTEPAVVTLSYLSPGPAETVEVTIPPGSAVQAPKAFRVLDPQAAVIARASAGTFVPASVSYSLGREGFATFAAALGIPIRT